MIENEIHRALLGTIDEQNVGWDERSQIIHLCRFLQDLSDENASGRVMEAWEEYLEKAAFDETRAMSDEAEQGLRPESNDDFPAFREKGDSGPTPI